MAHHAPRLCIYALGIIVMQGLVAHCYTPSMFGAYAPGDIVIGILGSIHSKVKDLQNRISPETYTCIDFDYIPFVSSLAAILTIEEINNSSFLPGIKLGYVMCDPCVYGTKALECVEHMLAINGSPTVFSDYSNFTSPIKAFLGERYSELSIPVAKLLSLYMIPQISCTSTAPALSDKLRYAAFFRVVPSDVYQTLALANLMNHYSWNWVGVVFLDDDYGRAVLENFVLDAQQHHVCIDFQEVLPNYLGLINMEEKIKKVADKIQTSTATVILLILRPEHVQMIFTEMLKRNIKRVWIASDAWSTVRFLMKMKDINKVGDIFGFTFITGTIPGLEGYLQNLRPSPGARNDYIIEYEQIRANCNQSQQSCNKTDDSYLFSNVDMSEVYGQRISVYALAHAIKKLLNCDDTSCSGDTNFLPWKLISILHEMNFTVDNQTHFFNKNGDFENGYDLIMWSREYDARVPIVVGKFLISNNNIEVYEDKIVWFNNMVPESRCSKPCKPGTHKIININTTCCYKCEECGIREYSDEEDLLDCKPCPSNETSGRGSVRCVPWKLGILEWDAAHSVVVIIATVIGISLLLFSIILFIIYRSHKSIKENLILLCIMQVGLLVSFGSVIAFLGNPYQQQCIIQQAMYGLGFTLCVSCILVKAFAAFISVMSYDPNRQHYLSRFNQFYLNITLLTGVQGLICVFWFIFERPFVVDTPDKNDPLILNRLCSQGQNKIGFAFMHIYIAVLAIICFLLAFKGRTRETEPIVFSMLFHLFVWLCFIPIFITKTEQQAIIQLSAILVSNYGVIVSHLTPKWYRICKEIIRKQITQHSHDTMISYSSREELDE